MALMDFVNVRRSYLTSGLYQFILFFFILLSWYWPYSLLYVINWVEESKFHSVETVGEGSKQRVIYDNCDLREPKSWLRGNKKSRAPNYSRWEVDGGY